MAPLPPLQCTMPRAPDATACILLPIGDVCARDELISLKPAVSEAIADDSLAGRWLDVVLGCNVRHACAAGLVKPAISAGRPGKPRNGG